MNTDEAFRAPLSLTGGILEVLKELSAEGRGSCDHSGIALNCERWQARSTANKTMKRGEEQPLPLSVKQEMIEWQNMF